MLMIICQNMLQQTTNATSHLLPWIAEIVDQSIAESMGEHLMSVRSERDLSSKIYPFTKTVGDLMRDRLAKRKAMTYLNGSTRKNYFSTERRMASDPGPSSLQKPVLLKPVEKPHMAALDLQEPEMQTFDELVSVDPGNHW